MNFKYKITIASFLKSALKSNILIGKVCYISRIGKGFSLKIL